MLKAIKIRLYPNKEQANFINRQLGCCRFLYNNLLAWKKGLYESEKKSPASNETSAFIKGLKDEYTFLREVHSKVLQQSVIDLGTAFNNFFRGIKKGEHIGYPKFKSKKKYNEACRFPVDAFIGVKGNRISIIKKLSNIHFKCSKRDEKYLNKRQDYVKSVTIRRDSANRYYASVLIEYDGYKKLPKVDGEVGIDVGVKSFAVTSDGVVYPKIAEVSKMFVKCDRLIKKYQKQLARTESDSKRHHEVRIKLAKWQAKKKNIREAYHHKVVNELLRENQTIAVEDLNVNGMLKNHKLARAIQDHGLSNFFTLLKYKAEWNDKKVVEVGRFYASSKLCNCCGYKKADLTLSDREWVCPCCGNHNDRDINAARNILSEMKRLTSQHGEEVEKVVPTHSESCLRLSSPKVKHGDWPTMDDKQQHFCCCPKKLCQEET